MSAIWLEGADPDVMVTVPLSTPSTKNCTVPVGVPPAKVEVTVAVKVTPCPKTEGLCEEMTVVVVVAGLTWTVALTVAASAVAPALAGPGAVPVKVAVATPPTNCGEGAESEPFTALEKTAGNGASPTSEPPASGVVDVPVTPSRSAVTVVVPPGWICDGAAMFRNWSQVAVVGTAPRGEPSESRATADPGAALAPHQLLLATMLPALDSWSSAEPWTVAVFPTNRLRLMVIAPASLNTAPPIPRPSLVPSTTELLVNVDSEMLAAAEPDFQIAPPWPPGRPPAPAEFVSNSERAIVSVPPPVKYRPAPEFCAWLPVTVLLVTVRLTVPVPVTAMAPPLTVAVFSVRLQLGNVAEEPAPPARSTPPP